MNGRDENDRAATTGAEPAAPPAREAVAVFANAASLYAAAEELLQAGFERSDLSMMANQQAIEAVLGHRIERVDDAEDDPAVPRRAYVAPGATGEVGGLLVGGMICIGAAAAAGGIFASGGTLAGAVVASSLAGGSGGLIGATLARFIGEHHGEYLHQQLDRGGILLWVGVRDAAHEVAACKILMRHSARDVHVHEIETA